jgi:Rrf2 family protein
MIGLTREADDALRIVWVLGQTDGILDTATLCEKTAVPPRFALKILRKLTLGGVLTSQRGKRGGYRLACAPCEITVRRVVELIDGPIALNRCADPCYECSRMGFDKAACAFHCLFAAASERLANDLESVTLAHILADGVPEAN